MTTDDLTNESLQVLCAEAMGARYYSRRIDGKVFLTFEKPPSTQMFIVAKPEHRPFKVNSDVSNYPGSVDACQPLIEEARKMGWETVMNNGELEGPNAPWTVIFKYGQSSWYKEVEATDPSLPRAICIAFLRLKGVL